MVETGQRTKDNVGTMTDEARDAVVDPASWRWRDEVMHLIPGRG